MSYNSLADIPVTTTNATAGQDEPDADFSSYFTIQNNFDKPLIVKDWGADTGRWIGEPPQSIKAGQLSPVMQIKDKVGFYGSSGYVRYQLTTGDTTITFTATIACPYSDDNTATFKTDKPAIASTSVSAYNSSGHPLTVTFTCGPQ